MRHKPNKAAAKIAEAAAAFGEGNTRKSLRLVVAAFKTPDMADLAEAMLIIANADTSYAPHVRPSRDDEGVEEEDDSAEGEDDGDIDSVVDRYDSSDDYEEVVLPTESSMKKSFRKAQEKSEKTDKIRRALANNVSLSGTQTARAAGKALLKRPTGRK
jgi:hypothetical protein